MQYLLLHTADPEFPGPWDDEAWAGLTAWLDETTGSGVFIDGASLRLSADATTVKVRGGQLIVTDGPYAETKEQIAGFSVIECASPDEAIQWAAKHPHSWLGASEVRALRISAEVRLLREPAARLPEPGEGKVRYLLFVCDDPAANPSDLADAAPIEAWVTEMDGRGVRLFGSELEPPAAGRTVRVRDSSAIVTDGPFAETKEQIAGFDILECADLDEAIEVAAKHPMSRGGLLEIRPFRPFGED